MIPRPLLAILLSIIVASCPEDVRGSGTLETLVASVTELSELRVQTDQVRKTEDGSFPVYELKRPGKGMTFLNVRVYVTSSSGGTVVLDPQDLVLVSGDDELLSFDLFHEDGLIERRALPLQFEYQGIINFTSEVPDAGMDDLRLRIKGAELGRIGELRTPDRNRVQFIVAEITELSELRMKTGATRAVDGRQDPVYELRRPKADHTFLHFRVYVSCDAGRVELTKRDLRIAMPGDAKGHQPFDWYLEKGLDEVRGETLSIWNVGTVNFTVEIASSERATAHLYLAGRDIGPIGKIQVQR